MGKLTSRNHLQKLLVVFTLILLVGCNLPTATEPTSTQNRGIQQLEPTKITFKVRIDQPIPAGDSIYISILDEVTGLAFNAQKYIMRAENAQTYGVTLELNRGAVIKYR